MTPPLARIRRTLTAWYVGVFAVILFVLGIALLFVMRHQISTRLDRSLESAAEEVIRAAEIRDREALLPAGTVVDAFEELRIPGRMLYVFDRDARLVHPADSPDWIAPSVSAALSDSAVWALHETEDDRTYRLFARRFKLPDGKTRVAVATADVVELENEYAALIFAFGFAGIVSLVLVALGGATLARRSSEPVELAFAQMRRFMADAAHELRTPLTVLRGRAEVALQRARTPDEYAAALAGIAAETERMGSMVEKMLLLSQADSGELRIRREHIFLDDLLVEAAEDARMIAADRSVLVEISELDEAPIHADRHLVRQMLLTIMENAVRVTPTGGRVLASTSCSNGMATATITDTGPGIPADALPHVFEPFFRADPARERTAGAGLGLAIARSIATVHGAVIDIASEIGTGTRVRIAFPTLEPNGHDR